LLRLWRITRLTSCFLAQDGVLRGGEAIAAFFKKIFAEFAKPGLSFSRKQLLVEGDHALLVWAADTADNVYELASHIL